LLYAKTRSDNINKMNYETRTYNQILESGELASLPEAVGIPKKYEHWVNARGAHMAPVLITRLTELAKEPTSVLANSISVAKDFHEALDIDYKLLDLVDGPFINTKSLFLYRNNDDMDDVLKNYPESKLIANPKEFSSLGKEILHPDSISINSAEDLIRANSLDGIPVATGVVVNSREELERMSNLFSQINKKPIFKDPTGTDGNGITTDENKVEKFPVVVEEMLDIQKTISVQYQNGVLGVMSEVEKPEGDKRWRGNTLPYTNGGLEEEVRTYAEIFAEKLKSLTGKDPVIFGMDFAIYKDETGNERLAFIDPNIRMPGNMYLYYQKALLEKVGYDVPFAQTVLFYEDEVPKLNGYQLQKTLDEMGFGLIKYKENGEVDKIRTNQQGIPEGVLVIVQDKGTEEHPDNLSMVSVFGGNSQVTQGLVERFKNSKF
jgi:hypothetical protein